MTKELNKKTKPDRETRGEPELHKHERQLFKNSCEPLRQEIKRITGVGQLPFEFIRHSCSVTQHQPEVQYADSNR
jgi:hypothetical protein